MAVQQAPDKKWPHTWFTIDLKDYEVKDFENAGQSVSTILCESLWDDGIDAYNRLCKEFGSGRVSCEESVVNDHVTLMGPNNLSFDVMVK